jgi:hypothetical protein
MTATKLTVQEAWAAVMNDVQSLGKDQRNDHQKFNFRGVDDVMNAVGPVLRAHGVSVIPCAVDLRTRDAQTTQGKAAHESMVVVSYTIYGPAGDSMPGAAAGESLDSGDKATPKAMSVAYRTFLLQALCLPTQQTDPDAETYQRSDEGRVQQEAAQAYANGLGGCTDPMVLENVRTQAEGKGLLAMTVQTPAGQMILAEAFGKRAQSLTQGAAA